MTARYTHATDEAKRRAVDKLVRPASISGASEPTNLKLKAVENSLVASGPEIFGNGLAPEKKTDLIGGAEGDRTPDLRIAN